MGDFDWVLKSRRVVSAGAVRPAAIGVRAGKIVALLPYEQAQGGEVRDVGDHIVLPGLVDSHAHINEPGRTEWEGFTSATRAAAAGGITTVVDMPLNCIPVTTSGAALREKLEYARRDAFVDLAFWGGVVPGNAGELEALVAHGARGAKAFLVHSGIDDFPHVREADLLVAMPILRGLGVPLLVHAELESDVAVEAGASPRAYKTYLASRPPEWEMRAIDLMIDLSRRTGCHVHIVHLSAAGALASIREAKRQGVPITVETCPHYLTLSAEGIEDGRTEFKCAPPIREEANRAALWQGLLAGDIDLVVSDHSPCTPTLKCQDAGDFAAAWGGISSLQLGLSLIWHEASARGAGLVDIVHWMSSAPARLAGLAHKGGIEVGKDADFVVFDPDGETTVEARHLRHRHKLTPYLGMTRRGRVLATYLRGEMIFDGTELLGQPRGVVLGAP